MRALVVDNKEFGYEQPNILLLERLSRVADIDEINYQDDSLEDRLKLDYGFVVLSQVPVTYKYETAETPTRKASVRKVIQSGKPIFGICLGFQSLGIEYGARLRRGEEVERGECIVRLIRPSAVFEGLGESFPVSTNHRASLDLSGSPLARVAESDDCEVQAVSHPNYPYDGVQFHPEESEEEICDTIFSNVAKKANEHNISLAA